MSFNHDYLVNIISYLALLIHLWIIKRNMNRAKNIHRALKVHKGLFLFCPQTNLFYINGFFYKIEMWIYFLFFPVDTQYTIFWQYYESILCPILCWSNNIKWNTTRFWIVFVDSNKLHWKKFIYKTKYQKSTHGHKIHYLVTL